MTGEATMPFGAPTPDWHYPEQNCPHCDEHPTANRLDKHIRDAHSDLPDCTARIDDGRGLYTCAFRAGHKDGKYGEWHASAFGPAGRTVWNDTAPGATPHADYEALKTRWLKEHGNPHAAHHVTELKPHPTEEPQ